MDQIIIGVDTHKSNHIAVAIGRQGARLGTMTIPTTRQGYRCLEAWASEFGKVKAFGIEGTGSCGAGLSRDLPTMGHTVLDVMRPDRQLRYLHGKSDSLERIAFDRIRIEGNPGQASRWLCLVSPLIR